MSVQYKHLFTVCKRVAPKSIQSVTIHFQGKRMVNSRLVSKFETETLLLKIPSPETLSAQTLQWCKSVKLTEMTKNVNES